MTQRKSVDNNPTEQDLEKNKDSPTLEQKNEQSSKQEPRWRFVSEEEALSLFLASQAKEKDSPQGKGVQAEKEEDRDTEERSSSEKRGGAFPRSLNSSQRNHQRKNGGAVANNNELSVQSGRNEAKEVANKKNFVPQEHDQKDRKKPVEEGRPSDKGREINQKRSQPPKKERFKLKPRSRPILPEEDPFDEE
jgi:hypothetical protein